MVLLIFLMLFSLSLFWYFDKKRTNKREEMHREKREAFHELLLTLRKKQETEIQKKETNQTDET